MNDPQADSEFAVSVTKQLKKNSNTSAGAGANANSKVGMTQFVGSDTLAELVWSPRTGLKIKFAEEKPCLMWEVGPSDIALYKSENTQNEENIASLATCHVSEKVVSGTGSQNQGAADQLYEHLLEDGMSSCGDGSGCISRPPLIVEPMMQCWPDQRVERDNVVMDNVAMDNVDTEKNGCFSDPFLENAQVAIFQNKTGEKYQVGSHGSMGSCRSANFSSKRKRECSIEQQLILGSKRIKNQANGSSFMNWISNTLRGLKNYDIHDPRGNVCDETRILKSKQFGFHNVFQSFFSPETIKQLENNSISSSSSKETALAKNCSHGSLGFFEIKDKEADKHVKHVSFYERVTKEAPKGMFDTIRMLRLSRTDILKWMNSRSSVAPLSLDGFFLRLRVAKWEEGGGSRYYVACIIGSQGETPWKDLKQSIRVKVGDVECLAQSQHVSNCDFLEDELIAWWQKTSKNGGIPFVKDLKSKLAERRTLGM